MDYFLTTGSKCTINIFGIYRNGYLFKSEKLLAILYVILCNKLLGVIICFCSISYSTHSNLQSKNLPEGWTFLLWFIKYFTELNFCPHRSHCSESSIALCTSFICSVKVSFVLKFLLHMVHRSVICVWSCSDIIWFLRQYLGSSREQVGQATGW